MQAGLGNDNYRRILHIGQLFLVTIRFYFRVLHIAVFNCRFLAHLNSACSWCIITLLCSLLNFVAVQKFSNKELFAMLFRPPLQASSEGGDRRNDNKSYTIQDPVEPWIARNRGVHVFKQIFIAITYIISGPCKQPSTRRHAHPLRLRRLRILLHWFPIVADMPPRSAASAISAMNSIPNRHFCSAINAIMNFFFEL